MSWNRKDYPPNWEEIRDRILSRAQDKCEECGVANGMICRFYKGNYVTPGPQEWDMIHAKKKAWGYMGALRFHGFKKVVLTIAHLDHDKENWQVTDDRLRAWCQRCHLNYDRSRHIENRKYGRNHRKTQYTLF